MLESLTIRNYAIIDEMTVEFMDGLNVITGETGAGKSIVVDALGLVLGSRASTDMIRFGVEVMEVTGVFTFDESFQRRDVPVDENDDVIILRREIRTDGNNRCFINDRPAALRTLKELGNRLVDFHGQHDHQSLLVVADHVTFLDGYGGFTSLTAEVGKLFNNMIRIRESIAHKVQAMEAKKRDRELYEFQLNEIENAKLAPDEDKKLEESIRKLAQAEDLKALGMELFHNLTEAEGSVSEQLGDLAKMIEKLVGTDPELKLSLERIEFLIEGIDDLACFFRSYGEKIENDSVLLAELEERLALVEWMKKKYGPTLSDVIKYSDRIEKELANVEYSEHELAKLDSELKDVESRLSHLAQELSEKRCEAAPRLVCEVETHLSELGMSGARLVIDIDKCDSAEHLEVDGRTIPLSKNGFDSVEFMISANPGEPPRSLVKVASGGEISRVMLSLKLSLIAAHSVPTMVFDEIDSGVSGRVAEAMGKKLRKLTEVHQALVITHLPQIAVMGDRHFSARKSLSGGRTFAGLVLLDNEMRQRELASLLSGENLTETALAHAKEMLASMNRTKN